MVKIINGLFSGFLICILLLSTVMMLPTSCILRSQLISNSHIMFNKAYRSVGKIYVRTIDNQGEASGTAFAYDKDHLLTAGHFCQVVIENPILIDPNIKLVYLDDHTREEVTRENAVITNVDPKEDLCIVELRDHGLIPVEFADSNNVEPGDDVYIIGAPLGFMISVQEGQIMDPVAYNDFDHRINGKMIISSAATMGNSGSPVFDAWGRVIGMQVAGILEFSHVNFCVPANKLREFIEDA